MMGRSADNQSFAALNQSWLGGPHSLDVDGWAGKKTQDLWRRQTGFTGEAASSSPWPAPDERSLIDFYGPPGRSQLVTIRLPYAMRIGWGEHDTVTTTQCHRLVADSLTGVLESILDLYGKIADVRESRMDLYGGCYNRRRQRGGVSWSVHAFGAAIDLDPEQNQNKSPWPETATMPLEVIRLFEVAGWKSGASAWGRDAMHFQATA